MNGQTLKGKVKEAGMSFNELARRAGILPQTLTKVFSSQNVSSEKVEEIARALGWSMGRIYGETAVNTAVGNAAVAGDQANAVAAEALSKAIDEIAAQRRIVERLIDVLASQQVGVIAHNKNYDKQQRKNREFHVGQRSVRAECYRDVEVVWSG